MFSLNSVLARALLVCLGAVALPIAGFGQNDTPGAVYTSNNSPAGNRVIMYARDAQGRLSPAGSVPTGGLGTGAGLGSQGAIAMTDNGRWLLVVNAGSNSLSVFSVGNDSLVLTDVAPSGGIRPISVTVAHNLVYVLNAGGAGNISGFYLSEQGELVPVPGSTRPLSGANVGPAQISFGLRGDVLVVTEKTTSRIDSFVVNDAGVAGPVISRPSAGAVPFGFAISSSGFAFVSEAPGSALSSYALNANGAVDLVAASVANHQVAACWVALSKNEAYAYTANAGNNTISGYAIGSDGSVTLLDSTGLTAVADDHPLDLAVSLDGRFVYSLNASTVVGFRLRSDGSLTRVGNVGGVGGTMAGLAAR